MSYIPNPNISSSFPDWDYVPFTDQELESIESTIHSTISKKRLINTCSEDPKSTRRRLPNSITYISTRTSSRRSFSLNSCPRYRPQDMKLKSPVMNFGGRIVYSKTVTEVEKSAAELLKFVEKMKLEMGQAFLGLDIEWRPSFRKGVPPGKAAVMQICGGNNNCYVMHIIHSGIPQNLRCLLEDPTSIKVGLGIGGDCTKIFKDHDVSIPELLDLSSLAKQKLGEVRRWGLESLTERVVHKQLDKPKRVRLGNWEADILSKAQLKYAATDAFVSWYLYEVLRTYPDASETKSEEELSHVTDRDTL